MPVPMAPVVRRIQVQAVLAMLVPVGPATQVRVERANTVHRFADKGWRRWLLLAETTKAWTKTKRSPLPPSAAATRVDW
jgi:hypothetical protein